MRILITGADGQLGRDLQLVLKGHTLIRAVWPEFDLLNTDVEKQVLAPRPDAVFHLAAYTDVDGAEREPSKAMAVNAEGTERVARAVDKAGARLIYLSTDYVFDGRKASPYVETDEPNPLNAYGRSKLEGERRALACCPSTLVVRSAWLYGVHGKNFVNTITRLASEQSALRVVADQRGCPTYAGDLAMALARMLDTDLRGVVHATGAGDCTWYEFACAIVSLMGSRVPVYPITTAEAGRAALRPSYSVLANVTLAKAGITLSHWKEALTRYMSEQKKVEAATESA
ncbi:MAG: dTDP-4-dehydrorhamnose reductase [Nitrospirae bacterium]|nr:MAG: dTDP-4-dehydrorhamnose reductase [Nitrospirota bacterium]